MIWFESLSVSVVQSSAFLFSYCSRPLERLMLNRQTHFSNNSPKSLVNVWHLEAV